MLAIHRISGQITDPEKLAAASQSLGPNGDALEAAGAPHGAPPNVTVTSMAEIQPAVRRHPQGVRGAGLA